MVSFPNFKYKVIQNCKKVIFPLNGILSYSGSTQDMKFVSRQMNVLVSNCLQLSNEDNSPISLDDCKDEMRIFKTAQVQNLLLSSLGSVI